MKLISKEATTDSIVFKTRSGRRTAFSGNDAGGDPSHVPDPIVGVDNNNYISFYSNKFGYCEVDWGDGTQETIPMTKVRGSSQFRIIFRSLDIEWYKNPDSHPWWFWKEDGSEYIPVPPHYYADGSSDGKVITLRFTCDIIEINSIRLNIGDEFPVINMPSLVNLSINYIGDRGVNNISLDKLSRSPNIERISITESTGAKLTGIPIAFSKLSRLRGFNMSRVLLLDDTESSNIRDIPTWWPDLEILSISGTKIKTFPREWLSWGKLKYLYVQSDGRGNSVGYDPNTMISMDEVDRINPTLTRFDHEGTWYTYSSQTVFHDYMSGKGLDNITSIAYFEMSALPTTPPSYMREMRALIWVSFCRVYRSQVRTDDFVRDFYDFVTGWDQVTMTSTANDGKRNQFYGLQVVLYYASHPSLTYRPSGTMQAPTGFVKGVSNGDPQTPMEMIYVLTNNYGQRWTLLPEATRSRSVRYPYYLVVPRDVQPFVASEGYVKHDDDTVIGFHGDTEGIDICERRGYDPDIVKSYFESIYG